MTGAPRICGAPVFISVAVPDTIHQMSCQSIHLPRPFVWFAVGTLGVGRLLSDYAGFEAGSDASFWTSVGAGAALALMSLIPRRGRR